MTKVLEQKAKMGVELEYHTENVTLDEPAKKKNCCGKG